MNKFIKLFLILSSLLIIFVSCSNGTNSPTTSPTDNPKIAFNFNGAIGLVLTNETNISRNSMARSVSTESKSNLKKVDISGNLTDVLTSGNALVSKFMIAPNNKVYILFSSKINLETSEPDYENGCLLAEVNMDDDSVISIDSTLSHIQWNESNTSYLNSPIQFDQNGAIYYCGSNNTNQILRKYDNGVITDLINDNININDFIVNEDGSVIISGMTTSTNSSWIRKITTSGGLKNIVTSISAQFLSKFPDKNTYMGLWGGDYFGVFRYLTDTSVLDSEPWISGTVINNLSYNPYNDITGTGLENSGYWGALVSDIVKTTNGKVYAKATSNSDYILMQYYPTLETPTISINKVSKIQGILSYIIVSGLDSSNKNKLILYDTSNNTEEDLLPDNDIEIYNINYVSSANTIMFDGINFDNNKMLIGEVDLITKNVNFIEIGNGSSAKLLDFKTF